MKTKQITGSLLVLVALLVTACKQDMPEVVERKLPEFTLDFLVGKWHNETDSSQYYEYWEKKDDGFFSGTGFIMNGQDTTYIEQLSIFKVNDQWLYSAWVFGQNSDRAVAFRQVQKDTDGIVFENRNHDFPQRIAYRRTGAYLLEATISGQSDEGQKSVVFPFRRMKQPGGQ